MSDDLTKRGPADAERVATKEEHEVRYWTKTLRISREELQAAVDAVGHMAKDVRAHLKK